MICLWTEYSFEYRNASILHEKKCAKKEEADRSYLEYTLGTKIFFPKFFILDLSFYIFVKVYVVKKISKLNSLEVHKSARMPKISVKVSLHMG